MNYLVIGQGGREHALVRALKSSTLVREIHVIPGNAGMGQEVFCHDLDWKNFDSILQFCHTHRIEVVIIGPEDPLVMGLSDALREKGVLVIGPSKAAAQLEGSKVYAKEFMLDNGVATARAYTVTSVAETLAKATEFSPPYVLKADGLAAGKGVVLCESLETLKSVAVQFFEQKLFGGASEKALLEEFLPGYELSLLLLTNGSEAQFLPLAQDHKQLFNGDKGPNTGGMGTVAPMLIPEDLISRIQTDIVNPTLKGLQTRNLFYRGVIFLGLMITERGPQLLEYNCRFGDPETQVVLPLLKGDWATVFKSLAKGEMSPLQWNSLHAACVVLASPGYPDQPKKGVPIQGALQFQTHSSYFLHAGTKISDQGEWQTNGGRVLCALGLGTTLNEARENAYRQAEAVKWDGLQKRDDIGLRTNAVNQQQ